MISLASNARRLEKLAIDNSPALLTIVGIVGTIGTAVLAHRAALEADHLIRMDENKGGVALERKQRMKERTRLVWKTYIPPVVTGSLTIGAIVGANRIGSKRAAAVAAAYTLSEKAFTEYREKVVEKFGETKASNLRDDLAQDQVARTPMTESNVIVMGTGDVLCCDLFSGRYFRSSVEELKKAQNDTNHQVLNSSYASLSDFYDRVGLPRTDVSEELGWSADELLELEFSTVLSPDGQPCVAYRFRVHPVRGYHKLH